MVGMGLACLWRAKMMGAGMARWLGGCGVRMRWRCGCRSRIVLVDAGDVVACVDARLGL